MDSEVLPYGATLSGVVISVLKTLPALTAGQAAAVPLTLAQRKLLATTAMLAPPEQITALSNGVEQGSSVAAQTLTQLRSLFVKRSPDLLQACILEERGKRWTTLRQDATLLVSLADACELAPALLRGLALLARARSRLGDTQDAVRLLRSALELNSEGEDVMFASVHESLGDALRDLSQFEEAYAHFAAANSLTPDSEAAQRLIRKESSVLIQLGEYRSAARKLDGQIQTLRNTGVSGVSLAMDLDMYAQSLLPTGDYTKTIAALTEARSLFDAGQADPKDRLINALLSSQAGHESGDTTGAAEAFARAHELAFAVATGAIDPQHYRAGFVSALAHRLPIADEANQLMMQGLQARDKGDFATAFQSWALAGQRAAQQHDVQLYLRIGANIVATCADLGQVGDAIARGEQVAQQASAAGLARPEYMVLMTLGSLTSSGAEMSSDTGALGRLARAAVLTQVQEAVVASLNLAPGQLPFEAKDPGTIDSALAKLADEAGHDSLAAAYYNSAVAKARDAATPTHLVNRLCGLYRVLTRQGDTSAAAQAASEIDLLLASGTISPRGLMVGHRTLAAHEVTTDRVAALAHLREACRVMEAYRLSLAVNTRRDFDRDFHDLPGRLAEMLRQDGDVEAAFDALQLGKGRSVIEAMARNQSDARPNDAPLTALEVRSLLACAGPGTVLVDFALTPSGIVAYLIDDAGVRALLTTGEFTEFGGVQFGDVEEREAQVVALTLHSPLLRDLAQAIIAAVPPRSSLMLVPDAFLHNLPLHAILVDAQPWGEQMAITYAPTAAILRFARPAAATLTALIAGDSDSKLPGARAECIAIASMLAATPLLEQACTRRAIAETLVQGHPEIVHLAVHGRADMRRGGRSSILVAKDTGGTEWLDFAELTQLPWTARLVVFSGCSTGVLGLRHGTELLSVANAALEAGASTVIASLWPVNDEHARAFMTSFYTALKTALPSGPVDLRTLLQQASRVVRQQVHASTSAGRRDGRHLVPISDLAAPPAVDPAVKETLAWAPFCLFGAPIFNA